MKYYLKQNRTYKPLHEHATIEMLDYYLHAPFPCCCIYSQRIMSITYSGEHIFDKDETIIKENLYIKKLKQKHFFDIFDEYYFYKVYKHE